MLQRSRELGAISCINLAKFKSSVASRCQILRSIEKENEICRTSIAVETICNAPPLKYVRPCRARVGKTLDSGFHSKPNGPRPNISIIYIWTLFNIEFNFDGLELTHYMQLWADKGALVNGLCLPNVFHQSSRGGLKEILLSRHPSPDNRASVGG